VADPSSILIQNPGARPPQSAAAISRGIIGMRLLYLWLQLRSGRRPAVPQSRGSEPGIRSLRNAGRKAAPRWPFLYSDAHPEVRPSVRKGQTIVVEQKAADVPVTGGLIHDWLGVSFIPGASIASLRALMQDYDNYKRIYSPDIIDSRLISRDGGHFRAFLQLENTQFLKLIYDSDYDIQYSAPAADRMEIVSRSTRIQQSAATRVFSGG